MRLDNGTKTRPLFLPVTVPPDRIEIWPSGRTRFT